MSKRKQMVALETGFYDGRRVRAGQRFSVDVNFSAKWAQEVKRTPADDADVENVKAEETIVEAKPKAKGKSDSDPNLA